jgi:hypothetical protein
MMRIATLNSKPAAHQCGSVGVRLSVELALSCAPRKLIGGGRRALFALRDDYFKEDELEGLTRDKFKELMRRELKR